MQEVVSVHVCACISACIVQGEEGAGHSSRVFVHACVHVCACMCACSETKVHSTIPAGWNVQLSEACPQDVLSQTHLSWAVGVREWAHYQCLVALKPAVASVYFSLLEENASPGEESTGAHGVSLCHPLDSTFSPLTFVGPSFPPGNLVPQTPCLACWAQGRSIWLPRLILSSVVGSSREPRQPVDEWTPCRKGERISRRFLPQYAHPVRPCSCLCPVSMRSWPGPQALLSSQSLLPPAHPALVWPHSLVCNQFFRVLLPLYCE